MRTLGSRLSSLAVLLFVVCAADGVRVTAGAQSASQPSSSPQPVASQAASASAAHPDYGAMVTKYCVTCHNQRLKTAGLSLDTLDISNPSVESIRAIALDCCFGDVDPVETVSFGGQRN